MNKSFLSFLLVLLMSFLLSACSSGASWEQEEVAVISDRLLADDVEVKWTIEPRSGADSLIRIAVQKRDGTPVEAFDITHEKLLHLMVISKDLSYFNHVHPEYKGGGVFEIDNAFPAGGEYRLIADFKPTDGDSMTKLEWMQLEGEPAAPVPVVPDSSLDNVFEGIRVKLTAENLEARNATKLTYTFEDAQTGKPIDDLQPYLGAIGHVVILSEDGKRYVHVHAEEDQGTGPEARFETEFPVSGIYKIWGQFQRDDQVFTATFVVNVP
jgi:hypothetical protein